MNLPPDQRKLYGDLAGRLDHLGDQAQLIAYMGQVLRSLLRRRGDGDFLLAVQDAFTTGLAGRDRDGQVALAREVIALVIAKRPEIAVAWQALNNEPAPFQRRAADQAAAQAPDGEDDDLPDLDLVPEDLAADADAEPAREEDEAQIPPYAHAEGERLAMEFVCASLERRLGIFAPPETHFPSVTYCHEQPFFLFTPVFPQVLRRFLSRVLFPLCREALERHVYRHLAAGEPAKVLEERRPDLWKVLIERLAKLATQQRLAEGKIAAAREAGNKGPEFQVVEVPVSRPRVFRVLGVGFRLGSRTQMQRMKVRVRASTDLVAEEMQALELAARLRDMAAQAGLDLPDACDFQFLRTLLEFDARKFAQGMKELVALAGHEETSRDYVQERLAAMDEAFPNTLSDCAAIRLFHADRPQIFGFSDLYSLAMAAARDDAVRASKRPFLLDEVGRRPRELAFQVREVLRRRYDEDTLAAAVKALLEAWAVMGRARFKTEMDAALTVLQAFPISFAGDHDEQVFTAIGHHLHRALSAKDPDYRAALDEAIGLYRPLAARLRAEAMGK